jgi:hypothetical protein
MRPMDENSQSSTFIVRVICGPAGDVSGVVERVRTGIKHKFEGREALCRLIEHLIANESGGQA